MKLQCKNCGTITRFKFWTKKNECCEVCGCYLLSQTQQNKIIIFRTILILCLSIGSLLGIDYYHALGYSKVLLLCIFLPLFVLVYSAVYPIIVYVICRNNRYKHNE